MKTVLFDENMPRRLRHHLTEFSVRTVQEEGWGSYENGDLLDLAEQRFDVLVTADRRMQFQQNFTGRRIAVIVLVTPRLRFEELSRGLEQLRTAIATIRSGEIVQLKV
ncbi:MAG TPA: DUF5615 family PIN-like protein [Thermoanaerobaculia bacterium]